MGAEGIVHQDGENIHIGDTPEAMLNAIETLMSSPAHYQAVRQSALDTIATHYSWQGKLQSLLTLLPDNQKEKKVQAE